MPVILAAQHYPKTKIYPAYIIAWLCYVDKTPYPVAIIARNEATQGGEAARAPRVIQQTLSE